MKNDGFTFVELLVAISIIGIISVAIAQVILITFKTNSKVEVQKEIKQNGDFVISLIENSVRNAKSVTCDSSVSLTVTNYDDTTTTFQCNSSEGQTHRIAVVDLLGVEYVTSTDLTIFTDNTSSECVGANQSLTFVCDSLSNAPDRVRVNFTLRNKNAVPGSLDDEQVSFQTAITTRYN